MRNATLLMLIIFLSLLAGCSKPSPQQLMQKAQEIQSQAQHVVDSLGRQADIPALFGPVLAAYDDVIRVQPGSPEAEQALFRLADLKMNVMRQPQLAVESYKRYVEQYPAGAKAPTALFMAGYLYNNELNNLDSAAAQYRRFLQLFPEDELATSAQFELNNLGKKPEEMFPEEVLSAKPAAKTPAKPARR